MISDQACLFFYLSPHQWIKAGVEFDMGKLWDGAVVCNPYSDWYAISSSFLPLAIQSPVFIPYSSLFVKRRLRRD
jgi:regulation of enolase protein 1 (concanavalin A-like superfamily)